MPAGYPGARSAQRLRDDIAIVVLQNGGVSAELNLELPADARSLAGLRRGLRRWLRSHGPSDDDVAEMTLAVNEACANAIVHAYAPQPAHFWVHASATDGEVTVMVSDRDEWRAQRDSDRGRGLTIIRASTDALEINSGRNGTEIVMRRELHR